MSDESPFPMPTMVCAQCGRDHDGDYCEPWGWITIGIVAVCLIVVAVVALVVALTSPDPGTGW